MMPKGVEHRDVEVHAALAALVERTMMPKGVEHKHETLIPVASRRRGTNNDAERR